MRVTLVTLPPPTPPPPKPSPDPEPAPKARAQKARPAPKAPRPPKPAARRLDRPARSPPTVAPILARPGPASRGDADVSDAELAGAATAGGGEGGGGEGGSGAGGCDMARWLQTQLRKDRTVRTALAGADGRAIRVWNGAWVRHGEEDGAGLSQVREAIMWHVAFAPEACRAASQRGLVLLTLADGPGAPRLVLGAGAWRWSDLLHARRGGD